jgi:hypothetical protein
MHALRALAQATAKAQSARREAHYAAAITAASATAGSTRSWVRSASGAPPRRRRELHAGAEAQLSGLAK